MKYSKGGWYGNSHGHALAARGIRLFAKKDNLVDPVFYAQKKEETVSTLELISEIRSGATFADLVKGHPDADQEDLRLRGIRAADSVEGNGTLSFINSNGIDVSVKMAEGNPHLRSQMLETLGDSQRKSFIQKQKADALEVRLKAIPLVPVARI